MHLLLAPSRPPPPGWSGLLPGCCPDTAAGSTGRVGSDFCAMFDSAPVHTQLFRWRRAKDIIFLQGAHGSENWIENENWQFFRCTLCTSYVDVIRASAIARACRTAWRVTLNRQRHFRHERNSKYHLFLSIVVRSPNYRGDIHKLWFCGSSAMAKIATKRRRRCRWKLHTNQKKEKKKTNKMHLINVYASRQKFVLISFLIISRGPRPTFAWTLNRLQ